MIIGIGVDIVKVCRIERMLQKEAFLNKVYTKNEKIYIEKKSFNSETAAGIFAAKEAVSKALGTGIDGFNVTDIEVIKDDNNKPEIVLYHNALELSKKLQIDKIHITISHEKEFAIAYAIAEKI